MLLRHALSARVTNWTSYRVLDAEIALPRICLSYMSGDPRFFFQKIDSFIANLHFHRKQNV